MKNLLFLLPIVLFVLSCESDPNEQVDAGEVKNETYTNEEIGWTMDIPEGFDITAMDERDHINNRGKEAFEDAGIEVDASGLKNLIGFNKGRFNAFMSTSEEVFDMDYDSWKENNEYLNQLVLETYETQGINVDMLTETAEIDGLEFDVIKTTVYGPDGNVILRQESYNRLIDKRDFCATFSYNTPEMRDKMWNAFKNSTFTKREH